MLAQERQKIIHDMLIDQRIVKISDISEKFGISHMTARRDLDVLWDQGIARRVYGGAILNDKVDDGQIHLQHKGHKHSTIAEVNAISKKAASLVEKGDAIFLGNGPIVKGIAKYIRKIPNLTIVTSSILVVNELVNTDSRIYILGGFVDNYEHRISGTSAINMLSDFCINKTFISCEGISIKNGVTTSNMPGAELGKLSVKNAEKTYIVAHSQVFGINTLNKVCSLSEITTIITDDNLAEEQKKSYKKEGVEIICVEVPNEDGNNE